MIFTISCGTELGSNGLAGNLEAECFEYNACNPGLICNENNLCVDAPKITKDTILVTAEESNNELIEVNQNELVFLKNNRTSLFKKGYILAFKETDMFEGGFIGRIKSVNSIDNKVFVETEEVSPFEILGDTQLTIDENIVFDTPIDPSTSNSDKSVTKTLTYDESFYRDTFKIKGDMSIKYNFKMFIDIRRYANTIYTDYHLIKFDVMHNIELTNNLDLNLKAINYTNEKIKIAYSGSDLFSNKVISTFTVYLPYSVKTKGEVYLAVRALYSGQLQGTANVKINTKSNFKSGLKYENNKTIRTNDYDTEKLSLDENIKVDGRAGITFNVTPEVRFSAYSTTVKNNVTIGTEILYTQALLNSVIETNPSSKSCYDLEGIAILNPYASLDMMTLYRNGVKSSNGVYMTWNKDPNPSVKNFNWLDGDKKCENFTCNKNEDCSVSQLTAGDTCNGGSCISSDSSNNYEFVEIPEGDFIRGCVEGDTNCLNDETPAKKVHLTAYKIGKKEVSVSQYKACVEAGSCVAPGSGNYVVSGRENHPINSISWLDAQRYCSWLGGSQKFVRLPTEAEWENAAKGGNNSLYPWGDAEPTCDLIQRESEDGVDGCGEGTTAEVGSKSGDISGYGVMDMAGNVSEYTGDYYDPAYYSDVNSLNNPKGPIKPTDEFTFIVLHGGDWKTHKDTSFRNSRRFATKSVIKGDNIGFRCVYKEETNEEEEGEGTVDKPIELGTLNPGYTHDDTRDTKNATSDYFDTYPSDVRAEYGKEFIYHFNTTEKVKIILSIATPEPEGTDIDIHLFRNLSATNPGLIARDDKKVEVTIDPGDYYISMDSFGQRTPKEGVYKLHIEVEGVVVGDCSNIALIKLDATNLPYNHTETKDTKNATNKCFNTYPSNTLKEYGKEYVYEIKIAKKVNARFSIATPEPNGTDIDLHLFRNLDSQNPALIQRDDKLINLVLEPGIYYLSLDSYGPDSSKEGVYKLTIDLKEFVPVPDGDWFNPYILKAVTYINTNHKNGGYNINRRYTHNLKYGDSAHNDAAHTGYLSYFTGGTLTMCSAAVTEVIIVAMQIYAAETGDWTVFDKLTRSKWDNTFIPWQFPMSSTGSAGIGDAVEHLNMGRKLNFQDLLPGAGINYNRTTGSGHAVIFIAFLGLDGTLYTKYPSGKTIVGFKYYSAQTSTNGMGYRLAIWNDYKSQNLCNKSSVTNGLPCENNGTIRTGAYGPNSGMLYMPSRWNP
jgi:formylglycine-generating enzyme required for sulfatase activity